VRATLGLASSAPPPGAHSAEFHAQRIGSGRGFIVGGNPRACTGVAGAVRQAEAHYGIPVDDVHFHGWLIGIRGSTSSRQASRPGSSAR
jgi:hypothetical protein